MGPGDGSLCAQCILDEKGAHGALTLRMPCLPPRPSTDGPWRCLHASSMGAKGMERHRPWGGCFACSPLPCTNEHPALLPPMDGNIGLENLVEDAPVQVLCWVAQSSSQTPG